MFKIRGDRQTRQVWIDGKELTTEVSQVLFNHSPDGFAWGYQGSGPAQLALAILLEVTGGDKMFSIEAHQDFKREIVSNWPMQKSFTLLVDVFGWIQTKKKQLRLPMSKRP